jgi:phospholipid:diacylglycerol acyltransferase
VQDNIFSNIREYAEKVKIYPDEEGEERVGDWKGEKHEAGEEILGGDAAQIEE